ncbi:PLP-dependent aspartate aminotransferase family protein [Bacillus sp. 03113]|uniref:trans-sulfuration enzyme family protein n=1 Tax=Bacillus sp. 03113 TaxID=2578211 RepID=UPI00114253A7|nr:aminotransferase class I/II-fold pyridoxal phosphate-dependent enzyme [Bacillus sp. 03113]
MGETNFSRETEILNQGAYLKGRADSPETAPLYLTTAFNVEDLDDLEDMYSVQGYTYIRTRNPNRNALAELVTYLEKGEKSLICSCGMAAISTALLSILEQGDHVLSDKTLYGETIDLLEGFSKFGISVTFIDFTNIDEIKASIKPNTKVLYTETISNPMITVVDIETVANIAHENGAKLVVDNTFTTSLAIRPIEKGADITINSLTKFANGHSDVVIGSITSTDEIIKKAYSLQVLLGTTANPFDAWMCQRGMRTMDLRVQKQMDNAAKLAKALQEHPCVLKVHHPSLENHPQHELAKKIFENGYGGMLSFEMPNDREKINAFMRRLKIVHYAMTLGGYRSTISHPVSSSHYAVPEEERLKMGITFGLMRVSVGIESPDDLIADFYQALDVFKD